MPQLVALSLSIGVLGAVATFIFLSFMPHYLIWAAFVAWCQANKVRIYGLGYIWHDQSQFQKGFYLSSHVVAYDVDNLPLQCAQLNWNPDPRNIADILQFRDKLARMIEP